MWDYITSVTDQEFQKFKTRQIQKYEKLVASQSKAVSPSIKRDHQVVVNVSDRTLTEDEHRLLSRGLNFVPHTCQFNNINIATNIELSLYYNPSDLNSLCSRIQETQKYDKKSQDNLSINERRALSKLKLDQDICILQADKGSSVVVRNKRDYFQKLDDIVFSDSYAKLRSDPSDKIDNRIRSLVKNLKKLKDTPKDISSTLIGKNSRNPSIYGAPKVHKPNIPLRPIVTCFGTVTEMAARYVNNILRFYCDTHKCQTAVRNSKDLITFIKSQPFPKRKCVLVSFDVVNLFGSLDLSTCKAIITAITSADVLFQDRFNILLNYFLQLVDICINSSFFEYKGEFYNQVSGLPMGSPCSPSVADLYMRNLEIMILQLKEAIYLEWWKRYVDDIIALWLGTSRQLDSFLTLLNTLDVNIKFTMELENDDSLPFLDVLIQKTTDDFNFSIYSKSISTGLVTNFQSFQPPSVKINTLNGEIRRYSSISDNLDKDLNSLKLKFVNNGYPINLIGNCMDSTINNLQHHQQVGRTQRCNELPQLVLPYMGKFTNQLTQLARNSKKRLISTNNRNLASYFCSSHKSKTTKRSNCIYRIPCSCGEFYVGETGKSLDTRIKQHKYAVSRWDLSNGLAVHAREMNHDIDWNGAEIISFETNCQKRKIKEALYIKLLHPKLNLNGGLKLQTNWSLDFLSQ